MAEIEPADEGTKLDRAHTKAMPERALDEPGIVLTGMLTARLMDGRHRAAKAMKLGHKVMRVFAINWTVYPAFIVTD